MPLVYQQNINESTKIGVWHISEDENYFNDQLSIFSNISHPHKRLQHFAGRNLLKAMVPDFPLDLILIADTRKPYLEDEAYHFSISHCGDYAAALVSSKYRVGVDIEVPHPKISRIAHKFLAKEEKKILQEFPLDEWHQYTLAWSIKEALFKWLGTGQIDFIKHLNICDIHINNEIFTASCRISKDKPIQLKVQSCFVQGNCLSWVVG